MEKISNILWKNTLCLVTGGNGFLGSHLVPKLENLGAEVYIVKSKVYDLRSPNQTRDLFHYRSKEKRGRIPIVFHLAATVGGIGATDKYAGQYFFDNATMGINVIEACKNYGWSLVVAGSVCEYPQYAPVPMIEENLWNGMPEPTNAPYGISKRAILAMQQAYEKQYDLKSSHILQANLYGPGDDFSDETSHVIPALIKRFINARDRGIPEVVVWGTGKATRDFLYVDDAADAYIKVAERSPSSKYPINIGTGFSTTISFVAERIKEYIKYDGKIVYDATKPDGQMKRQLRIERAVKDIGWEPKVKLSDGLRKTIEWYEDNR